MPAMLLWLVPVILGTWEAEIRKIVAPGQPGQKKGLKTPSKWKKAKCGSVLLSS
jgi:hypothetical protein